MRGWVNKYCIYNILRDISAWSASLAGHGIIAWDSFCGILFSTAKGIRYNPWYCHVTGDWWET